MPNYKLVTTRGITTLQRDDGAVFPMSTENRDYQEYLRWVSDGNTPQPADPAPLTYNTNQPITARTTTTDATPKQLFRTTLAPNTGYISLLTATAVDTVSGDIKTIRASIASKRVTGNALLVGNPVVLAAHGDPATAAWAITGVVSGTDFVVSVVGAVGRTIAWSLSGSCDSFTPSGV